MDDWWCVVTAFAPATALAHATALALAPAFAHALATAFACDFKANHRRTICDIIREHIPHPPVLS